jgi:hypothetical protein
MRLLHQDMTRDHQLVRAYPCHHHHLNRRVQMALRAATAEQVTPAIASAPANPPTTEPSYRPMEHSPPHPAQFTLAARSNDLGRFYGQTEGVTPLLVNGDAGTNHVTASAPLKGGATIDLNISATAPPSLTLATMDSSPNRLWIRSPPLNPNPNGSPPHLSLLGNQIIHQVIRLPSTSTRSQLATTPWGVVTNTLPSDSTVRFMRFH